MEAPEDLRFRLAIELPGWMPDLVSVIENVSWNQSLHGISSTGFAVVDTQAFS